MYLFDVYSYYHDNADSFYHYSAGTYYHDNLIIYIITQTLNILSGLRKQILCMQNTPIHNYD